MAEINPAIALQVQTPNLLNTMGNIANVANSVQQLRSNRAAADTNQMVLQERQAIAPIMQDLDKYKDDSGGVDYNRLFKDMSHAAPTTWTQFGGMVAQAHQQSTEAQKSFLTLNTDKQKAVMQVVGGTVGMPPEQTMKILDLFASQNPSAAPYVDFSKKVLGHALSTNDPKEFSKAQQKLSQLSMSAESQVEARKPSYVGAGGQGVNVNPLAEATGSPSSLTYTLPPTQTTVGPQGQPSVLGPVNRKDALTLGGGVLNTGPTPQQAVERPARTQQRMAINTAAAKAPEMQFNNDRIIELADVAITGTGSDRASKIFSTVGLHWDPKNMASNAQQLGHFMALQAQNNAQVMGAGTDAARAIAEQATGSKEWNPAAIKATAKINSALTSGVQHFNVGMNKAVKSAGGDDMAVGDFQNAWSQNFDVNAMRLLNAAEKGNKTDYQEIIKSLGPARAKELAAKVRNLKSLTDTGTLPQ